MFGIGGFELFLILLFGFLIFGPDKLPAMAKTIGKAIGKFRSAQEEMNKVIKTEVYDPTSDEPFKNPLEAFSKISNAGKDSKDKEKVESFSERKAKYDKERAAKKAAGAKEDKTVPSPAKKAEAPIPAAAAKSQEEPSVPKGGQASKPSPDELYGTKPAVHNVQKPAASPAAQPQKADEKGAGVSQGSEAAQGGDAAPQAKEQLDEAAKMPLAANEKGE